MRIAIDYTTGVWPGAGVARYTRALVAALAALDSADVYTLFYGGRGLPRRTPEYAAFQQLLARHRHLRARELPASARQLGILWNRLQLPLPADRLIGGADVLHAPDFVAPPVASARTVITIHDLSFLVLPEVIDPGNRAYLSSRVPRAARRADRVIAVSEATRRDVIERLHVAPERVLAVPNGVEAHFRPVPAATRGAQAGSLRARLGLPAHYILHVGTLEPRKNLVRLIGAYARLVARGEGAGHDLVLAGRRGWLYDAVFAAAAGSGVAGRIHFVDYVPEADLPLLYNLAGVFAYPSLYEGFGLPVIEAMACGTPVVTSRTPALTELAGEAAVLVAPLAEDELAAALASLLHDPGRRAHLVDAGMRRAARYPWSRAAETVRGVYEELQHPR